MSCNSHQVFNGASKQEIAAGNGESLGAGAMQIEQASVEENGGAGHETAFFMDVLAAVMELVVLPVKAVLHYAMACARGPQSLNRLF